MMKFPFRDSPNTAVITCAHVLEEDNPIMYITHDEDDGMWQFLCGGLHTEEDARVVSLYEMFACDRSVAEVANMPLGFVAERSEPDTAWIIRRRR